MKRRKRFSKRKIKHHLHKVSYPSHYLALALLVVVFVEGAMFGVASGAEAASGLSVLDLSQATMTTQMDVNNMLQPLMETSDAVNKFYLMSSEETMLLLEDNIVDNIGQLVIDIKKFYISASDEVAKVLDLSNQFEYAQAYMGSY